MTRGTKLPDTPMSYTALLDAFEPRPILCDEQYWATQAVIDQLLSKATLSEDEQSYLHLLGMLMEANDEQQTTIPELRGVELLRALLDESGLKQRDLLLIFKHESTLSDVLSGRRKLTLAHISKLAAFFKLPHQLFFEEEEETLFANTPTPNMQITSIPTRNGKMTDMLPIPNRDTLVQSS